MLKFRLSENHTKFEKNLPLGFDKSADLLSKRQNKREIFSNFVAILQCLNFKDHETPHAAYYYA